jgi:uncharacterized protein YndB with AHSA1/START domain
LDAAATIDGMARAEAGVHIDRPPDEVFAFVADVTNNPSWRKNVTRAEWLDDGPMRIGRRGRQAQRVLGREWTVEAEIVEWDPPHRVTWEVRQGPVKAQSWARVEPDGAGCMVIGGADGGFTGPIGGFLTRLAEPRMLKQAAYDFEALRKRLESGV